MLALEPVPRAASGVWIREWGQLRVGASARSAKLGIRLGRAWVEGQCEAKTGKRKSGSGKGKVRSEGWMYG